MNAISPWFVFSVCFMVSSTDDCVERQSPEKQWSTRSYPNPQTDPHGCGRNSSSYLCDPDGLLSKYEGNRIDEEMAENNMSCQCHGHCPLLISIALMGRIESNNGDVLSSLKDFTTWLKNTAWKFGNCKDEMYIAVSDFDKKIYVRTGVGAQRNINDDCVNEVVKKIIPYLCERNYYDLLKIMIREYRKMYTDTRDGVSSKCKQFEKHKPSTATIIIVVACSVVGAIVFVIVKTFCKCDNCDSTSGGYRNRNVGISGGGGGGGDGGGGGGGC